ncbi:MAG: response regulator [Bacillota bacterium]|nr:response regulator [Bacillota bacterium]
MKVIIVDDELHVREGIKLLGEWDGLGIDKIYEAGNGDEAIQLIQKYRPEIIFSDMKMPKMDGTQLLEWIKENQPNSKTIVVTGYDDYHYMRKAITFGSFDYLLKPIDPEILNQTLEKAIKEWKKEEVNRSRNKNTYQLINEMKPVYRDRKLTQFLNNNIINTNLYKELGFHDSQKYEVGLVPMSSRIMDAFQGDRDLAYFTVLNVINEFLSKYDCGIGFRYLSNKGEMVIIFWSNFEQIETLFAQIYNSLQKHLGIRCPMFLGIPVKNTNLMDSYHHAKQVLLSSNVLSDTENKVYRQESQQENNLNLLVYASDIELAVQAGEMGAFEGIFEDILQKFKEMKFLSLKQLMELVKEYQVICNRWLKHFNISLTYSQEAEAQIGRFFNENGVFQLDKFLKRKRREISLFLKIVKRQKHQESQKSIYEIEKYLQTNYDRDVKLQEIADRFYLSREYISRKFKQEFKENISDYVVNLRMQKAKYLLTNSQLKVYEIASMIGYQDDKYFRKLFKKVEGITPNEYRSIVQNNHIV